MSNFFNLFGGDKDKRSNDSFSLEKLHGLHRKLLQQKQQQGPDVVETIRQITEALLWGEKNDSAFFEFFCEKNILSEFVDVLTMECSRNVKIQLLQTLSMLVQNIKTKTSLYYIFSNNHLNMLIGRSLDWKDEEILAYYITLLKSIAIRLNVETVNFFFKPHEEEFPLYTEAIRFFNHRDQMIRAAIRTLTLQIYKIEDVAMRSWIIKRGGYYFTHLACYTRDLWLRLNAAVLAPTPSIARIREAIDQVEDLHMYIHDTFAVGIAELDEALGERLLVYAIYPYLVGALVRGLPSQLSPDVASFQNSHSPDVAENSVLGRSVAIYLLQRVLVMFSVQSVIGPLVETLSSKQLSSSISCFCYGKIAEAPVSYPDMNRDGRPQTTRQMLNDRQTVHLPSATGVKMVNPFRGKLLKFMQIHQTTDSELFLATSLIHTLLTKRTISRKTLEDTGFIPPSCDTASLQTANSQDSSHSVFGGIFNSFSSTPSSDEAKWDQKNDCLRELILPMCQGFQHYNKLRSMTLLALQRTITELLLAQPRLPANWMPMIVECVGLAARKCATELREYLKSDMGNSIAESFTDQWEAQKSSILDLNAIMSDAAVLIPGAAEVSGGIIPSELGTDPLDWVDPCDQRDPKVAAFRHLRCFLILRRFHRSIVQLANRKASRQTLLGPIIEPLPFDVSADVSGDNRDGLVEGHSIELSKQNRILCDLSGKKGQSTRYFFYHSTMVVLVQPDLASAGWGIIRTLCPTRCVESYIDRGDPRTLNLFIIQPGIPPGDATLAPKMQDHSRCYSGNRPSYSMTLTFDDTRRCHLAQSQINSSRNNMRGDMMKNLVKFVEQHS